MSSFNLLCHHMATDKIIIKGSPLIPTILSLEDSNIEQKLNQKFVGLEM